MFAHQIPLSPNNNGRIRTESIWNTSVRKKEIMADTPPLLSAVKNDEVKIFIPANINENANILNALTVILKSSVSYPTKILASGYARTCARHIIITPAIIIISKLL